MMLNINKKFFLFAFILAICTNTFAINFSDREDGKIFIKEMVKKHNFNEQELINLFKNFESSEEILKKISTPYEEKPWHHYKKIFITKKRIEEGVAFWKKHKLALQKAERTYGVPAEIIVAILGVETFYGKNAGQYPVIQSLATLAFDYPKRSAFFKSELEQYLLLTREQRLPAKEIKGSYAGAMGVPQFISSSYRNFGVDFDNAGTIDLINNIPNAIGSIANYFKKHGWQNNQPIIFDANIKGEIDKNLLANNNNPRPTRTIQDLKQYNVHPSSRLYNPSAKVALIEFDLGKRKKYCLARENFYVITRYNHSSNYAMAVYELSKQIAKNKDF